MRKGFTLLLLSAAIVHLATAQLTLVTSPYTQNFDTIASGLPAGWSVRTGATATSLGTATSLAGGTIAWSTTTGQFGNQAAPESPAAAADNSSTQSNRTDRTLAVRQSGSYADPGAAFCLQLANTSGLTGLTLSFKLQQMDAGSAARTTTWRVDYGLGSSPSTFTALTTSPATLSTTVGTWGSTNVTVTLPAAVENQTGNVWLRIVTLNAATGSGNRPATGIDDVSITFSATTNTISTGTVSTPFCAGTSVSVPFTSVGTFSGNTYTAQLSNAAGSFSSPTNIGTLTSNGNSGSITATIPAATAAGTAYRIRVVSSSPAVTGTNNGSNLTINAAPQITSGPAPGTYCSNYSAALVMDQPGGTFNAPTQGSTPGVAQLTYAGTPGNYNFAAIAAGTTTFTYAGPTCNNTFTYTINAAPAAPSTPSGPATPCSGSTGNVYTVTNVSGTTYSWGVSGTGWSIPTASTTNSVTVTAGTAAGTLSVTATKNGCTSTAATATVTPNITPSQPSVISGPSSICASSTGNVFSVTNVSGATYNWSVSGTGWSIPTSSTSNSVTITSGTSTGTVTVSASVAGCNSSNRNGNFAVSGNASTPGTISQSPSGTVCAGGTYVYSVTNVSGVTYNWTLPGGWAISNGGNGNSVTVTAGSSLGTISVTATNACSTSGPRNFSVSAISLSPVFNTQPVDVTGCGDNTITLSTSVTGASSLLWQYSEDNGSNWNDETEDIYGALNTTTQDLTLEYPATNLWDNTQHRLQATSSGGCVAYSNVVTTTVSAPTVSMAGTATNIYTQNFGTATAFPSGWSTYTNTPSSGNLWTNDNLSNSSGYTGASGGRNARIALNASYAGVRAYLESEPINTTGKTNITVLWAARMTNAFLSTPLFEYSADGGTTWTEIPYISTSGLATTFWDFENDGVPVELPADAGNITNLKLRWSAELQNSSSNYRIDDITVKGVTITTGASICGGGSFNLPYSSVSSDADKYTVTAIPAITGFSVTDVNLTASPLAITVPSGTPTGTYRFDLSVKNSATGCSSTASKAYYVKVTTPTFTEAHTDLACDGSSLGSITLTAANGTTPYTYSIDNLMSVQVSNQFNNLNAGTYNAKISDGGGCQSASLPISIIEPISVSETHTDVLCYGAGTGSITATATSNVGAVYYSIDNLASISVGGSFSNLAAGTYDLIISNFLGCQTAPLSITITQPASAVSATATNTGPYAVNGTISLSGNATGGTAPYSYAWSGPVSFSSTQQNPTRANATSAMSGNYVLTVTDDNGCTAASPTSVVVGNASYTWTGTLSTNWHTAGNWNLNLVPNGCASNVIIPAGTPFQPVVSSAVSVKDISVANNVNLTLVNDLSVCGDVTLGGANSNVSGSGLLRLAGAGNQTINGNGTIENLAIDNTNGIGNNTVTIATGANIKVQQELRLKTGVLQNNGSVTLLSSAARTAYLNDFCAGCAGTYSGNITAQRAVGNGLGNDQHFIGVPVTNRTVADLSDDINTAGTAGQVIGTGSCNPNQSAPNSPYGHVFKWNENVAQPHNCFMEGWEVITNSAPLSQGNGVSAYIPTGTTLDVTGAPVTGNVDIASLTNSNQGYSTDGWVLLANPYPSVNNLSTSRLLDGFDNQVQIWQTSGQWTGTYQPYSIASGVSLAQFQGFFVHVTNPGAKTWHFYQNERSNTQQQFFLQANDNTLTIKVNGNGRLDKTVVGFNAMATYNFDAEYDADKFRSAPGVQTLYTGYRQQRRIMGINTLPSLTATATVPMGFAPGADGQFVISAEGITTFDPTTYIYLEDKLTGAMHNLRNGDYTFTSTANDDENRFVLHFTPAADVTTVNSTCNAEGSIEITQPGAAEWNYTITDAGGNIIASGILNEANPAHATATAGIYTLTVVDNSGYTVVKNVTVNGVVPVTATFSLSATTVTVGDNINFNNTTGNAVNYTWSFGDGGEITGIGNPSYVYTEPGTYTVTMEITTTEGCTATTSETVIVNAKTATGIQTINNAGIQVYSYKNQVVVDFSKMKQVNATIQMFNMLGQELVNEKYNAAGIYTRAINNLETTYVVVKVTDNGLVTTKKVLITN